MSRFIDKLKNLHKVEVQPMGFMPAKVSSEKPRLQMVAWTSADHLDKVSAGLNSADAVLVEVTKSEDTGTLEKVCQDKSGAPAGGWLKASNGALKKLMNTSCDFVVLPPTASFSVTQKDKLGRILELDLSLGEGLLRTVNDLPVDAALIAGDDLNLTFNRLMQVQRLMYMINKPVLASVPPVVAESELQALWDMGVSGIVVELTDEKSAEKFSNLPKTIEKLNPPAFRKKARLSPMLPHVLPEAPQPPEEEEGGGEEDE
jgi:hypothetical protein